MKTKAQKLLDSNIRQRLAEYSNAKGELQRFNETHLKHIKLVYTDGTTKAIDDIYNHPQKHLQDLNVSLTEVIGHYLLEDLRVHSRVINEILALITGSEEEYNVR